MGSLLNTLWGRIMTGVAGACLALALLFCVLWLFADGARAREHEARLTADDNAASALIETKRTQLALTAAETRAADRAERSVTQRNDEDTINDIPASNTCGASPAVVRALGILRHRREGNPPAAGDPADTPDLR